MSNQIREPTLEEYGKTSPDEITALDWLAHPVTEDGSGYQLLSPAGGFLRIAPEERKQVVAALKLAQLVREAYKAIGPFDDPYAKKLRWLIEASGITP
jgi:hypothetical protein